MMIPPKPIVGTSRGLVKDVKLPVASNYNMQQRGSHMESELLFGDNPNCTYHMVQNATKTIKIKVQDDAQAARQPTRMSLSVEMPSAASLIAGEFIPIPNARPGTVPNPGRMSPSLEDSEIYDEYDADEIMLRNSTSRKGKTEAAHLLCQKRMTKQVMSMLRNADKTIWCKIPHQQLLLKEYLRTTAPEHWQWMQDYHNDALSVEARLALPRPEFFQIPALLSPQDLCIAF
jgi:hypothetical protein